MNYKVIREPEREIPVLDSVDVLVAGGGISGCAAALSSARAGARTILLERNGFLGGVAAATMMASIGNFLILADGCQVVHGFAAELINRLVADGSASPGWRECKAIPLDSERLKIILIEMLEESGVSILTHAPAVRPIVEDSVVRGVFIESKSGRQAILAKNIVDATGELDLLNQAGEDCMSHLGNCSLLFKITGCDLDRFVEFLGEDPEGFPARRDRVKDYDHLARMWREQGVLLFPHYGGKDWRFLQKAIQRGDFDPKIPPAYNLDVMGMYALRSTGHVIINSTYYIFQSLDVRELSRFELHAQRMCYYVGDFLRNHVAGFEKARVEQVGVDLGLRGARTLKGRHTLTKDEVASGARFDDVIGLWPVRRKDRRFVVFADETFDMPFGMLVPSGAKNILCGSGKSASTEGGHNRLARGMSGCMIIGQAAGAAAALGSREGVSAGEIPIRALQGELLGQGAFLGDAARLKELGLK